MPVISVHIAVMRHQVAGGHDATTLPNGLEGHGNINTFEA